MTRFWHSLFLVVGIALCGCAQKQGEFTGVPKSVLKSWHSERSYYALVEIVDAYIDPSFHQATKQRVEELLGNRRDDGHPGASPDCWIYSSSRRVPHGSYLCIYFDERDVVRKIDWISE